MPQCVHSTPSQRNPLGPISSNAFSSKVRKNAQNAKSLSATFAKMNWESAFCASRERLRDASYASRAGLRGGVPGDWSGIPGLRDHRTPDTGVGVAGRTEPCACFSLTCCGCRLLTSACCVFACLRSEGISNLRPPTSDLQNPQVLWNALLRKTRPQALWNPLLQNYWT